MGKNCNFKTRRNLFGAIGFFFALMAFLAIGYKVSAQVNVAIVDNTSDNPESLDGNPINVKQTVTENDVESTYIYVAVPSSFYGEVTNEEQQKNIRKNIYFQVQICQSDKNGSCSTLDENTDDDDDFPINIGNGDGWESFETHDTKENVYQGNVAVLLNLINDKWLTDDDLVNGETYEVTIRMKLRGTDTIVISSTQFNYIKKAGSVTGNVNLNVNTGTAIACSERKSTITFYFFFVEEDTKNSADIPSNYLPSTFSYDNIASIITVKLNENTITSGIDYTRENGIKVVVTITGNGEYKATINLTNDSIEKSIKVTNCYNKSVFDNQSSNVTGFDGYERIAIYSKEISDTTKNINKETYKVVSYKTTPTEPKIQVNTSLGISSDLVVFKLYKEGEIVASFSGYQYSNLLTSIGSKGVGNYTLKVDLGTVEPITMKTYSIKVVNLVDIKFKNAEKTYFYGTSYDFRKADSSWTIAGLVADTISNVSYTSNGSQAFSVDSKGNEVANLKIENAASYTILATGAKNSKYGEEYFPLLNSESGVFTINKSTKIEFKNDSVTVTLHFLETVEDLKYNGNELGLVKESEVSLNNRTWLMKEDVSLTFSASAKLTYFDNTTKSIDFGNGKKDTNSSDPGIDYLISKIKSSRAGTYTITLKATSNNYDYTETKTVKVAKSAYGDYKSEIKLICTSVTYKGTAQVAECTFKVFDKEFDSGNGTVTLTSINNGGEQIVNESGKPIGVKATNAGTYSIMYEFTGDNDLGECAANADNVWTITKMDIKIKFISGTGIYTGSLISLGKCSGNSDEGCFFVTTVDDENKSLSDALLSQIDISYKSKKNGIVTELKEAGTYKIVDINIANDNFKLDSNNTVEGTYTINVQIFNIKDTITQTTFEYTGSKQTIFKPQLVDVNGNKINSNLILPITVCLNDDTNCSSFNNYDINKFEYGLARNAGTYTLVVDTSSVKDNFNGEESITFSKTISKGNLTIKLSANETNYNGEKFDFTKAEMYDVEGLKSGDKLISIEYTSKAGSEMNYGSNDIINVGTYNIKVSNFIIKNGDNDSSSNYNYSTMSFDFTVVKVWASITFVKGTIGYTGNEITSFNKVCDTENTSACFTVKGFLNNDFVYDSLTYTIEYSYSGSYGDPDEGVVKNAGTYRITPIYSNNNYEITNSPGLLVIERVSLNLVFIEGTIVKIPNVSVSVPFCENATDSACISVTGAGGVIIDDSIKNDEIISYYVNGNKFVSGSLDNITGNVQTFTITPYIASSNYDCSSYTGGTLTIEKAKIYFDVEESSGLSYDKTEQIIAKITLKANSEAIDFSKFTYSYTINGGTSINLKLSKPNDYQEIKQTNAGTYTIKVSINSSGVSEADIDKYVLVEKEFSVEIAKSTADSNLYSFTCDALTYNGKEQQPTCKFSNESVEGTIEFLGEKQKNVGSYTSDFKVSFNDESYEAKTMQFTWFINCAKLKVSFIEKVVTYTGTFFDLVNVSYYNVENWFEENAFTYYVSSIEYSITNDDNLTIGKNGLVEVGEYTITPDFSLASGYDFSSNYEVENIKGKFVINSVPISNVDIEIILENNLTYNGNEQKIATIKIENYLSTWYVSVSVVVGEKEYRLNGNGLKIEENFNLGYEADLYATYAGEYQVKVVLGGSGLTNTITEFSENKVIIAKKDVEVKVIGGTTTYSGKNGGFYLDGRDSNKGVCTYDASACFEVSSIGNDYREITFKVEKGGNYLTNDEGVSTLNYIQLFNAGTYNVSIVNVTPYETVIEGGYASNYNITTTGGVITINKATVNITFTGNECYYNGTSCAFTVSGERVKNYDEEAEEVGNDFRFAITKNGISIGSSLTETEALNKLVNVGEYTISISIDNDNYRLSCDNSVVVKINKVKLEVIFNVDELTYTGENQKLVSDFSLKYKDGTVAADLTNGISNEELRIKICKSSECGDNWLSSSDNLNDMMPLGKDSATYTICIKVKGTDNFEELEETRSVTIKKSKITIRFNTRNISYNDLDAYNSISSLSSYYYDYTFSDTEKPEYVIYKIKSGSSIVTTNESVEPDFSKLKTGNTYTVEVIGFEKTGFDYSTNYEIINGSPKGTITIIVAQKISIKALNLKTNLVYEGNDLKLIESIEFKDDISINEVGDIFISYIYCSTTQNCSVADKDVKYVKGINNVVGKEAGYYYIKKIEITGGNNYEALTMEYNFGNEIKISKARLTINASYKNSYTKIYTGGEITISYDGHNGGSFVKVSTIYKKCSDNSCTSFTSSEEYAKDVGTYKVITSFEIPSNYEGYNDIETTLYVNKSSINLDLNWEDTYKEVEYDGNLHTMNIVYGGTDLELSLNYTCSYYSPNGDFDSSVSCKNGGVNAGTYYINAEVSAGDNYSSSSFPQVTLVIKQKVVTFGMYSQTISYDGNKHFIEAKSNDEYDVSQISLEYKINGTSVSLSEGVIDSGDYTFELVANCLTSNYKISTNSITSATLKIEKALLNSITINNSKTVYSGVAQTPVVNVNNGLDSSNYQLSCSTEGVCSLDNLKDAGEYTIIATGSGNYTGSVEATFEIEKALLTISFIGQVQVFGSSYSFENISYYNIEGLVEGEEITSIGYSIDKNSATIVENVDEYTIIPNAVNGIRDINYEVVYNSGVFKICNSGALEITINPNHNLVYTGEELKLISSIGSSVSLDSATFSYTIGESDVNNCTYAQLLEGIVGTNAGTYNVEIAVEVAGFEQKSASATIEIAKADYDLSLIKEDFENQEYTYGSQTSFFIKLDGVSVENDGISGSSDKYKGLKVTYSCQSGECGEASGGIYALSKPASYKIKASFEVVGDYANNYNIPSEIIANVTINKGLLAIKYNPIIAKYSVLGINLSNYVSLEGNGSEDSNVGGLQYCNNDCEMEENWIDLESNNVVYNVGTHLVAFRLVAGDYFTASNVSGNIIIDKGDLTLEWTYIDNTYTVDMSGNVTTFSPVLTIKDGEKIIYGNSIDDSPLTVSFGGDESKNVAGSYTISYSISGTNYNSLEGSKSWQIKKATLSYSFNDNREFTYDGKPHAVNAESNNSIEGDVEYIYKNASGEILSEAPSNAGVYYVSTLIKKDNYNDLTLSEVEFEIKKRVLDLEGYFVFKNKTVSYQKGIYNTLTISINSGKDITSGLTSDMSVPSFIYSYLRDSDENNDLMVTSVGVYNYVVTITETSGNYDISAYEQMSATLTITKATLDIIVDGVNGCEFVSEENIIRCIYNGNTFVVSGSVSDEDVELNTLITKGENSVEEIKLAGEYKVTISYEENDSYVANSRVITIYVELADFDINGIDATMVDDEYNGQNYYGVVPGSFEEEILSGIKIKQLVKEFKYYFGGVETTELINVGTYTAVFTLGKEGYSDKTITTTYNIVKTNYNATINYSSSIDYKYGGQSEEFITAEVFDVSGNKQEVKYDIVSYASFVGGISTSDYLKTNLTLTQLSKGMVAGLYKIRAKVPGNENYNDYVSSDIEITVNKIDLSYTVVGKYTDNHELITNFVYTGEKINFVESIAFYYDHNKEHKVTEEDYGNWITINNSSGTEIGGYNFSIEIASSQNYNDSNLTQTFNITKQTLSSDLIVINGNQDLVYNGTEQELATITVYDTNGTNPVGNDTYGVLTYLIYKDSSKIRECKSSEEGCSLKVKDAGSYYVVVKIENSSYVEYFESEREYVDVAKAELNDIVSISGKNDLVFDGNKQKLVDVSSGDYVDYTIKYYICSFENCSSGYYDKGNKISQRDAGTYYVYYYVTDDSGNYNDLEGKVAEPITIRKKDLSYADLKLKEGKTIEKVYDGLNVINQEDIYEFSSDLLGVGDSMSNLGLVVGGTYSSKNVGDEIALSLSISINNTNYNLVGEVSDLTFKGKITKNTDLKIEIKAGSLIVGSEDKVTLSCNVSGFVANESSSIICPDDISVDTSKKGEVDIIENIKDRISFSDMEVMNNYDYSLPEHIYVSIGSKVLTIDDLTFTGTSKIYDKSDLLIGFGIGLKENSVDSEHTYRVSYSVETTKYDKDIVGNRTINIYGVKIEVFENENWIEASDYTLDKEYYSISGEITKREIDVSKFTPLAKERVYNGGNKASVEFNLNPCSVDTMESDVCIYLGTTSGVLTEDLSALYNSLTLSATYDNSDVGENRKITFNGIKFKDDYSSYFSNYELVGELNSVDDAKIVQNEFVIKNENYTVSSLTKVYDGTDRVSSSFIIEPSIVENIYLQLNVVNAYYESANVGNNINITATVSCSPNYKLVNEVGDEVNVITISGGSITKKKVTLNIEVNDREAVKDNRNVEFSKCEVEGLVDSDIAKVTAYCNGFISGDMAGEYNVTYNINASYNTGEDISINYEWDYPDISVSITKSSISLVVEGQEGLVYDGNKKHLLKTLKYQVKGIENDKDDFDGTIKYCYIIEGSESCNKDDLQTKADSYQLKVKFVNSSYYEDVESDVITVNISSKDFEGEIISSSSLTYNGNNQQLAVIDINSDATTNAKISYYVNDILINGNPNSEGVYINENKIYARNAGNYRIKVVFEAKNDSFNTTYLEEEVSIEKKILEVGFISDTTLSYKGEDYLSNLKVCVEDNDKFCLKVNGLVEGEEVASYNLKLTDETTLINAGNYQIEDVIDLMINENGNIVASSNYEIVMNNVDEVITINKKKIDVTINDSSKKYNTVDPEFSYSVEGLVGEDKVIVPLSRDEGEDITDGENDIGIYSIFCKKEEFVSSNYEIRNCEPATFTILSYKLTLRVRYLTDEGIGIINDIVYSEAYDVCDEINISDFVKTDIYDSNFAGNTYDYYYYNEYNIKWDDKTKLRNDKISSIEAYVPDNTNPEALLELVYSASIFSRTVKMCATNSYNTTGEYCNSTTFTISGKNNGYAVVEIPTWDNHIPSTSGQSNTQITVYEDEGKYYMSYYFNYEYDNGKTDEEPVILNFLPRMITITLRYHHCETDADINSECIIYEEQRKIYYGTDSYKFSPSVPSQGYSIAEGYTSFELTNITEDKVIDIKCIPSSLEVYLDLLEFDSNTNAQTPIEIEGKENPMLFNGNVYYGSTILIDIPVIEGYEVHQYYYKDLNNLNRDDTSFSIKVISNQKSVTIKIIYLKIVLPVIELVGEEEITIKINGNYVEKGAYVIKDGVNIDLGSTNITWENGFDNTKVGTYYRIYSYTDVYGHSALEVRRIIRVVDDTKPVITLKKLSDTIVIGKEVDWNSYIDTISDAYDASEDLVLTIDDSEFDVNTKGTYHITFTVTDPSGNSSVAILEIKVVAAAKTSSSLPLVPIIVGVFGVIGAGVGGVFLFKYLKKRRSSYFIDDDHNDNDSAF